MPDQPEDDRPGEPVRCPRCDLALKFLGTKRFHEGSRAFELLKGLDPTRVLEALGACLEHLNSQERFDLYGCPRCGHVEFFLDGVGDDLRGEHPDGAPLLFWSVPESPGGSRPEWSCPGCGEVVPGGFQLCWNCQSLGPEPTLKTAPS